jgi:DNA-binding NarL/FixJ family response regulator
VAIVQPENTQIKILIVEDTRLTATHLAELIYSVPYQLALTVVDTELDGIKLVRDDHPDIIIIDLILKQGIGFNVLRCIAEMEPKPTAIVLTNFALPNYKQYALLNGAEYFLDKARDLETLPSLIESIVRGIILKKQTQASHTSG